jgi:hypothetical protein
MSTRARTEPTRARTADRSPQMIGRRILGIGLLTITAACNAPDKTVGPGFPARRTLVSEAVAHQKFLPYGVPVPIDAVLDAIPQPYDPLNPPIVLPSSIPASKWVPRSSVVLNDTSSAFVRSVKQGFFDGFHLGRGIGKLTTRTLAAGYQGLLDSLQAAGGLYTLNVVDTLVGLPTNTSFQGLAESTHQPPNSCAAGGNNAVRAAGSSTPTVRYLAEGDGCDGFFYLTEMDATWRGKYLRTYDSYPSYFLQIIRTTVSTSTCASGVAWIPQIFNFTLAQWESLTGTCDDSGFVGLESFDISNIQSCGTLPFNRSESILVLNRNTSVWSAAVPSFTTSSGYDYYLNKNCFANGTYTFVATSDLSWEIHTP